MGSASSSSAAASPSPRQRARGRRNAPVADAAQLSDEQLAAEAAALEAHLRAMRQRVASPARAAAIARCRRSALMRASQDEAEAVRRAVQESTESHAAHMRALEIQEQEEMMRALEASALPG